MTCEGSVVREKFWLRWRSCTHTHSGVFQKVICRKTRTTRSVTRETREGTSRDSDLQALGSLARACRQRLFKGTAVGKWMRSRRSTEHPDWFQGLASGTIPLYGVRTQTRNNDLDLTSGSGIALSVVSAGETGPDRTFPSFSNEWRLVNVRPVQSLIFKPHSLRNVRKADFF